MIVAGILTQNDQKSLTPPPVMIVADPVGGWGGTHPPMIVAGPRTGGGVPPQTFSPQAKIFAILGAFILYKSAFFTAPLAKKLRNIIVRSY